MSAAHTPGPWIVHPVSAHVMSSELDGDGDLVPVCAMLWPTELRSEEVTQANARLITAAPELLEALERLLSWALEAQDQISPGWNRKYFDDSDFGVSANAIAKARGDAFEARPNVNPENLAQLLKSANEQIRILEEMLGFAAEQIEALSSLASHWQIECELAQRGVVK